MLKNPLRHWPSPDNIEARSAPTQILTHYFSALCQTMGDVRQPINVSTWSPRALAPLLAFILLYPLTLTSCASSSRILANRTGSPTSSTSSPEVDRTHDDSSLPISTDLLIQEMGGDEDDDTPAVNDEDGFCRDDIYAQHLIEQYRSQEKSRQPEAREHGSRKKRPKNKKPRFRPDGDYVALSYARDRMHGKAAPYFGAIPVVVNNRVDYWVQYFKTSGRKQFMKWLIRGESLKDMVQPLLRDGGIPMEFYYLAMVESGFNTGAKSRARATGTWQFMRGTAQLYGLTINQWVDERLDPVKSTIAAANYLRDLYAELGDWYLAMAAYNAGPGKMRSAIRRTGSRDFWHLAETRHISRETANYVPKVLAAVLLASNPKGHGFDISAPRSERVPDSIVVVRKPLRLTDIAQKLGVSHRDLRQWNPELIRGVTPPRREGYELRVTQELAQKWGEIETQVAGIEMSDVLSHTIRKGETLSHLARRYKVSVRDIRAINPELTADRLKPGKVLVIPIPGIVSSESAARLSTSEVL